MGSFIPLGILHEIHAIAELNYERDGKSAMELLDAIAVCPPLSKDAASSSRIWDLYVTMNRSQQSGPDAHRSIRNYGAVAGTRRMPSIEASVLLPKLAFFAGIRGKR